MKIKPKNVRSAILIVVIVFALLAAAHFLGIGTTRSAIRIGYVGNEGWREWSASYTLLDGSLRHTLRPRSSDTVLYVDVKTVSGTISIEIKDAEGKIIFQQEDIGTNSFDIEITGKVFVIVKADEHKGSFSFSFKSTD